MPELTITHLYWMLWVLWICHGTFMVLFMVRINEIISHLTDIKHRIPQVEEKTADQ